MMADMAARAEPMRKVMETVLLTLMPMSSAVSRSWETARMEVPSLVLLTSRASSAMTTKPMIVTIS